MNTYQDLKKAILNRSEDREFIKDDIFLVDLKMDSFRQYFNAVFEQQMSEESMLMLLSEGLVTEDEVSSKSTELEELKADNYEKMLKSAVTLNKQAKFYGLENIVPEVKEVNGELVASEQEFVSFTAKYIYETYQKGVEKDDITLDTVIAIADAEGKHLQEAYEKDDIAVEEPSPLQYTKADMETMQAANDQISERIEDTGDKDMLDDFASEFNEKYGIALARAESYFGSNFISLPNFTDDLFNNNVCNQLYLGDGKVKFGADYGSNQNINILTDITGGTILGFAHTGRDHYEITDDNGNIFDHDDKEANGYSISVESQKYDVIFLDNDGEHFVFGNKLYLEFSTDERYSESHELKTMDEYYEEAKAAIEQELEQDDLETDDIGELEE